MSEPKLTEAEQSALACRCHVGICPLHNEASDGYVEHAVDDLLARVETILRDHLAPVLSQQPFRVAETNRLRAETAEAERDEARANRDRLAQDNAALRQEVADLTAGRDEARIRIADLTAELHEANGEHAGGWFWSRAEWSDWSNALAQLVPEEYHDDVAQEAIVERALTDLVRRAETAERALARVRAVAEEWAFDQGDLGNDTFAIRDAARAVLTALDGPAPKPDEGCPNHCREGVVECWSPGGPCEQPNRPGCETCGTCNHCTPPTTDAEEANDA